MDSFKWKFQTQERSGTYYFSGRFIATKGVVELLSEAEIMLIYWQVRYLGRPQKGHSDQ